jgi:very-short-patch-repair endonuclease
VAAIEGRRFTPKVTRPELILRRRLRKRGIPFVPQKRIKTTSGRRYLVDLLFAPKLVVEVGYIGDEDVQEDEDLRVDGYTVLRYSNRQVTQDVGKICDEIDCVRKRLASAASEANPK